MQCTRRGRGWGKDCAQADQARKSGKLSLSVEKSFIIMFYLSGLGEALWLYSSLPNERASAP
jgi:hypothetical protein